MSPPTEKEKPDNQVQAQSKAAANSTSKPSQTLSQQYGGIHTGSWVSLLPASWTTYIQLSRLSPPVAISLIYFPYLFGVLLAAILVNSPPLKVIQTSLVLLLGTLFFSNAAHAWNDLIDYPIDALTSRTKSRPIPRGAISPRAALVFALSQAVGAVGVLVWLTPVESTICYAAPNLLATMYYPFAKRHTNFVQVVLGVCLGWGVFMGSSSMGVNPLSVNNLPPLNGAPVSAARFKVNMIGGEVEVETVPSVLLLFVASVMWTVLYDTIYAHQDLKDDLVNGVKSLAVLFRGGTKYLLWGLLGIMSTALVFSGITGGLSVWYGVVAAGGSSLALGRMIWGVDLADSGSCWWWFKYGYWLTGLSMTAALVGEYLFT